MKKLFLAMVTMCLVILALPVNASAGQSKMSARKAYKKAVAAMDKACEKLSKAEIDVDICISNLMLIKDDVENCYYELNHISANPNINPAHVAESKNRLSEAAKRYQAAEKALDDANKRLTKRMAAKEKAIRNLRKAEKRLYSAPKNRKKNAKQRYSNVIVRMFNGIS